MTYGLAVSPRYKTVTLDAGDTIIDLGSPDPFPVIAATDVMVLRTRAGAASILVLNVDYAVSLLDQLPGARVTLAVPALEDDVIEVIGARPIARPTDLTDGQKFNEETLNAEFDALVLEMQEARRDIGRAVKAAYGTAGAEFPPAAADQVIGWNEDGTALENKTVVALDAIEVSDDPTLAGASHIKVPNEFAVKSYVDAGPSTAALQAVMRDRLDTAPYVATRTALAALDTTKDTVAYLTESGREGKFVWRSGNFTTQHTNDTQQGVYVKATAIASSAGSWVREIASNGPWLASWFGAIGDDATANDTALAGAISAFGVTGGTLVLGTGTFRLGSLAVNKPVVLQGMSGQQTTVLKSTVLTGDVLTITAWGANVRDIKFDATGNRTSGSYIQATGVSRTHFERLYMQKYYRGISFSGCVSCSIRKSDFRDGTPDATAVNGCGIFLGNTNNVDNRIDTVTMDAAAGLQPTAGIWLQNCDATQMVNVGVIHHGNDLQMVPGNGESVAATYVVNSMFDTAVNGIRMVTSGTGTIPRASFIGVWSSSHSNNGCNMIASGGVISSVNYIGCQMQFNGSRGMLISGGAGTTDGIRIVGGNYNGNAVDGIAVADGVNNFSIIGAQSTGNVGQGIQLVGASDNFTITGNDLRANGGALLTTLAPGPTRVIHSNLGVSRVVRDEHIASVAGTPTALSNSSTSAQNIFPAANDALTLLAGTRYRFKAKIGLNTGATSHQTVFGLGGTATFVSCAYTALSTHGASAATIVSPQMISPKTAAATIVVPATTDVRTDLLIEGEFEINAAGTVIPQITFSAGPTGTCEVDIDSFFECWAVGPNAVNFAGQWG